MTLEDAPRLHAAPAVAGPRPFLNLKRGGNSFGFLRLVMALSVIVSHSFFTGGFAFFGNIQTDPLSYCTGRLYGIGTIAVAGFFFISGILITQSFERSPDLVDFGLKRFLRIYPGYFVCMIVSVAIIAPIAYFIQHHGLAGYLQRGPTDPFHYVLNNITVRQKQDTIQDVFHQNPANFTFNASLWTLAHEMYCYVAVAILGVVGVFKKAPWVSLVVMAGCLAFPFVKHIPLRGEIQQYLFFSIGMVCYLYRDRLKFHAAAMIVSIALLLTCRLPIGEFVTPFALCYIFSYLAAVVPYRHVGDKTDLSYGVYIYGFPIQQLLTLLGANAAGWWVYTALCLICVTPVAWLSWTFVEKPSLGLIKRRLRAQPAVASA